VAPCFPRVRIAADAGILDMKRCLAATGKCLAADGLNGVVEFRLTLGAPDGIGPILVRQPGGFQDETTSVLTAWWT
jgi:hypothetical protein